MQPVPPSTPPGGASPLLRIANLSVTYGAFGQHAVPALRNISLDIHAGEIIGILGESGCGKSTLASSLLRMLSADSTIEGSVLLQGNNILGLNKQELRNIRGAKIALIHQEPGLSLSPVMCVGDQISEVIRAHLRLDRKERRRKVSEVLSEVRLSEMDRIYRAYPHQLSGGELHRVAIAQALACRPDLVIADESTRSLDLKTQTEILELLAAVNHKFGTAILFITHNPALLAGFAQRVVVMHDGCIVEEGNSKEVFRHPLHPYTADLLKLVPRSFVLTPRMSELSL